MVAYSWPGNIAELRNAVEYAAIHCSSDEVGARDLPECTSASSVHAPQLGGDFTLAEIEAEHIRRVAGRAPSEIAAAAILGICRSTLWRRRERTPIGCGDPSVQAKGAASPPGHP
jgi:transcriptional regulator of acetoin/glycerol metabolism